MKFLLALALLPALAQPVQAGFEFDVATTTRTEFNIYGGRNECTDTNMRLRIAQYWEAIGLDPWDGCCK